MLFHTKFVLATILGVEVHWGRQQRTASATAWSAACQQHWLHTLIGIGCGWFAWSLGRGVFWWFVPICAGLALSIPLCVFTSRKNFGAALRHAGLLLTPEEMAPPPQLQRLNARLLDLESAGGGDLLLEAIRDPYLNALHVAILRQQSSAPSETESGPEEEVGLKLLGSGPGCLTETECELIAANADIMAHLHQQYWLHFGEIAAATASPGTAERSSIIPMQSGTHPVSGSGNY
jgi:membrane glycosyltransferase